MRLEVQIGERAKQLRLEKEITLKGLSEKTKLSVGYLSQFERGINTIAIDALAKIADVLEVDLTYFFPDNKKKTAIVLKKHERELLDVIGENYIVTGLSSQSDSFQCYPRLIEILPSMKKENLQVYAHEGEEFIYVLEGILTLYHEDQVYHLYPGDTAHYASSSQHNWANDTNMTVKVLCVSTPNPF